MQYYESLGLEPRLALDPADLQQRFYARSREWHPDKFSRASLDIQQRALDMTALLNDAFRTLREPVTRAEYFLKQNQIELGKEVPPGLLEEVFELNMALDELRDGDASMRPQVADARGRFAAMLAEIDTTLAGLFSKHDANPGGPVLEEIRGALNRRRYISNLIRTADEVLNDAHPADRMQAPGHPV